ncbi:MAG: hypothetical protein QXV35_00880 [Archaeoglobaceae archaeon]
MEEILMHNICGAGTLNSIVFCCSTEKDCPFRTQALEMLGISEKEYMRIKEKNCINANVCFDNLAYCCSLEKKCEKRDSALKELNWSAEDYLNYKRKLLIEFKAIARNKDAFSKRVINRFAVVFCNIDSGEEYRGLAVGTTSFLKILQYTNSSKAEIEIGNGIMVLLDGDIARKAVEKARENNCGVSEFVKMLIEKYDSLYGVSH